MDELLYTYTATEQLNEWMVMVGARIRTAGVEVID